MLIAIWVFGVERIDIAQSSTSASAASFDMVTNLASGSAPVEQGSKPSSTAVVQQPWSWRPAVRTAPADMSRVERRTPALRAGANTTGRLRASTPSCTTGRGVMMSTSWVYPFDRLDEIETAGRRLGHRPWTARRQGGEPGRDDPAGHSRTAWLHRHHPGLPAYLDAGSPCPTGCGRRCGPPSAVEERAGKASATRTARCWCRAARERSSRCPA